MSRITMRLICDVVCEYSGFSLNELRSDRRHADLALARQHAIWLGCELTEQTFPQIGRFIARDHTTILYSHRKITGLRASDETFRELSDELVLVVMSAARSIEASRHLVPQDIDAPALARTFFVNPRAIFTASKEDIQALAAACLAGEQEAEAALEQAAAAAHEAETTRARASALAAAVARYLKSYDAREAENRAERLEAAAQILAARNHLKDTLEQWRSRHGEEHDSEGKDAEPSGSVLAR